MNAEGFRYAGSELDVFAAATQWKAYWSGRIRRWVRGDVLEVGAGLGVNTRLVRNPNVRSWLCLEPDPELADAACRAVVDLPECAVKVGTIRNVSSARFDSILYIDVLEHIEADGEELAFAAQLLRAGGHLVVLAPAHRFLFSEFDAAIGHFRRYDRATLRAVSPPGCLQEAMYYLDSAGVMASAANAALLRQGCPTPSQIRFWDKCLVPVSRVLDPIFGYRLGKTICGVWTRPA